jgi:ABC-type polysaccharide/polyol phosphate transport system ATPase subunit
MAPVVEGRRLSKSYRIHERPTAALLELLFPENPRFAGREIPVFEDVSFSIPVGESLGIIGRNGAGKSTLLRILSGVTRPTSGTVTVAGEVASFLGLGVGFDPDLSGRRNIFLSARLLGFSREKVAARTPAVIEFAELGGDIDRPLRTYSSGMRMRLAFAIAAQVDPQVLLLDEVLAVGDQRFQTRCLAFIKQFKARGGSLVFVSHDLGTVRSVCERCLWLEAGSARALGESWSVIRQYQDFVRELDGGEKGTEEEGSGELVITEAELLGADGRPRSLLTPDESLTIRLHYRAVRRIERPNFGLAIHRADGLLCYGTSTHKEGHRIEAVSGDGHVDFVLERIGLLAGSYDITVGVYDEQDVYKYHHAHRKFRFSVRQEERDEGVCRLQGHFVVPDTEKA